MFITRSRYERLFFSFFLLILAVLVISTVMQIRSSESMKAVFKDDSHRHKRSVFDSRHQTTVVGNELTISPSQPHCTYWNCIDSYKCLDDGKGRMSVYVYDMQQYIDAEQNLLLPEPTKEFVHLLWAIVHSRYIVDDPAKACILIPSIDLLNRENFSGKNASKVLSSLPHWNNGTNHLLFNMVPGVPPSYLSLLDFPHGNAMVTGSGFTQRSYRRTFDVAVPLFNSHQRYSNFVRSNPSRKYFLTAAQMTFYQSVYNQIRSMADVRPAVVVLEQCSGDGMQHQTCDTRGVVHSYPAILTESQFCLVTRERQLATPYLHDILRAGCVPVICMDTYIMPFSEVLDWHRAAVFVNEYRLNELPEILTSILADGNVYQQLQEQGNFYYERYFESMAKIALTTLDIINSRVLPSLAPLYEHWNRPIVPSAPSNPFFVPLIPSQAQGYTAVMLTYDRFELMKQVVINIAKSKHVSKILVIWNNPMTQPPDESHWPAISVPLKVIRSKHNRLSNRFYPYEEIDTDCVLTIDDDITMVPASELDFGYRVWAENADRLVGFPPRYHSSNGSDIKYDSEWMSNISMVLTGVAFYHKYYHYLFTSSLPGNIKDWVDEHMNCEDIAMNYLIANVTGKAPIKLLPRKKFKASSGGISSIMTKHLVARNVCMKKFTDAFGSTPLRTVEFRADPVLYKQEGYSDDMRMYKIEGEL